MVGCGQVRCCTHLSWSLLMLRLTAVGVNGEGPQPTRGSSPVSSSSSAQPMAATIWSGERPGGRSPGGG
jgi:hypothetical protein